jgi:tRNA threonylcarbamoyladenosine biosynthesis protein TsaB
MVVLALDTTTRKGSAALARDGQILAAAAGDASIAHGERLPGDLVRLLDACGLRVADVDLFAVAAGPGSLTGLRIGIAAMQGLALATGKPLAGVSALDAIHDAVDSANLQDSRPGPPRELAVWMDAGRGQVYSAVYSNGVIDEAPLVDEPANILARWARIGKPRHVFAGDGAIAYRREIDAALPGARVVEPLSLLAPSIARLAAAHVSAQGACSPDAIRPLYIRRSDVELKRDAAAVSNT